MDLLNWKSHNRNELPEILKRITFVERPEMMKVPITRSATQLTWSRGDPTLNVCRVCMCVYMLR
jgi:hypothetical protein